MDKRADLWAFGVVLCEMLTGTRLFEGATVSDTLASVLKSEPDWTVLPAQTPASIRRLLRRCLEKDRKRRLPDAATARLEIDDGLTAPVGEAPPASAHSSALTKRRTSGVPWVAAAAAALAATAVGVVHFREVLPERQVLQYSLPAPENARHIQTFAVSPDGHYVVMDAIGGDGRRLWVRALDSLQANALAGTENASFPFWSPDSRSIGFFAGEKLKKISVTGGPAQILCDANNSRGGTWGRDGVVVFAPDDGSGGLRRVSAAGGVSAPLTKTEAGTHRWPVFLPDARRFLYMADRGTANGIFLASLDSSERRRLVQDESNPMYVAPNAGRANGHLLFVRERTLMAQPVDPQNLEARGDVFPVAEDVSRGPSNGSRMYSLSDNGVLIYQTGGRAADRQHLWFDRAGKELGAAGTAVRSQNSFALSPDGKRVAIERESQAADGTDLWILNLEHNTESRFTFDRSNNSHPVWSPDGSTIAFASNRGGGTMNLYQRASNNTGQDTLLLSNKDPVKLPTDWSRDGRFIIFRSSGGKTNEDLWALPLAGEKKPLLLLGSTFLETLGQLSPDGRWLAYASNESGRFEVLVRPFPPGWATPLVGQWQVSTVGGTQPRWRGDGKELFYIAPDQRLMTVEVKATPQSFERGTPQALFVSSSDQMSLSSDWGYVPSADGKRFLISTVPGVTAATLPLTVVVNWFDGLKAKLPTK